MQKEFTLTGLEPLQINSDAVPTAESAIPEITCDQAQEYYRLYQQGTLAAGWGVIELLFHLARQTEHAPDCPVHIAGLREELQEKFIENP